MLRLILIGVTITLVSGCATHRPGMKIPGTIRAAGVTDTTIEIHKKWFSKCVKRTKTTVKNCTQHNNDETCNFPGDEIIWKWKQKNVSTEFKIEPKTGFASVFVLPDPGCTGQAKEVKCTIKLTATPGTFVDYNIVFPGGECSNDYDPKILIY